MFIKLFIGPITEYFSCESSFLTLICFYLIICLLIPFSLGKVCHVFGSNLHLMGAKPRVHELETESVGLGEVYYLFDCFFGDGC